MHYLEFRVLVNIKDCGEGTHFCTDVFALRVDEATIQGSTYTESELTSLISYRGSRRKIVQENSNFCTVFCLNEPVKQNIVRSWSLNCLLFLSKYFFFFFFYNKRETIKTF